MLREVYEGRLRLYDSFTRSHGGYWRHGFVDHAYLYNLYFPPERFFDLAKSHIHELISSYPVAQHVVGEWMGELIGQAPERIVVGNGAAELIKIICGHIAKKVIVPVPSFNEYANAANSDKKVVEFALDTPSFQLDVVKFAREANRCDADIAVVVSPNNPTSLLVPKAQLTWLADELAQQGRMLIVDESFIDFAKDRDKRSLEMEIENYPNLLILKSMSKAYGICGIRLGYMLTANQAFAKQVRAQLHIWNINGFAETFLKEAVNYREEFDRSCDQVGMDRDEFFRQLHKVDGLVVYEPEANYLFCRLPDGGPSGPAVAQELFIHHNIYVKHCRGKSMPESDRYLRIASRTPEENTRFTQALGVVLESAAEPVFSVAGKQE